MSNIEPGLEDVWLGGGRNEKKRGNMRCAALVRANRNDYRRSKEKRAICNMVVQTLWHEGRRFYRKNESGVWYVVDDLDSLITIIQQKFGDTNKPTSFRRKDAPNMEPAQGHEAADMEAWRRSQGIPIAASASDDASDASGTMFHFLTLENQELKAKIARESNARCELEKWVFYQQHLINQLQANQEVAGQERQVLAHQDQELRERLTKLQRQEQKPQEADRQELNQDQQQLHAPQKKHQERCEQYHPIDSQEGTLPNVIEGLIDLVCDDDATPATRMEFWSSSSSSTHSQQELTVPEQQQQERFGKDLPTDPKKCFLPIEPGDVLKDMFRDDSVSPEPRGEFERSSSSLMSVERGGQRQVDIPIPTATDAAPNFVSPDNSHAPSRVSSKVALDSSDDDSTMTASMQGVGN